jgi:hypothetical protein
MFSIMAAKAYLNQKEREKEESRNEGEEKKKKKKKKKKEEGSQHKRQTFKTTEQIPYQPLYSVVPEE